MNKKGFTLIELIAVIIIMGLLLIIVAPALSRLIQSGSEKKYNEYYDLVIKAAEKYSREKEGELGGVSHSGCVENITINDLVNSGYLKKFEEDGITCGTPADEGFVGSVDAKYKGIRIENEKGHVKVTLSLVCKDERNNIEYSKLNEVSGECVAYVPEVKNTIYEGLKNLSGTTSDGDIVYITDSNSKNYVQYSGRLWRIYSYNDKTRVSRAILDEGATILNFDGISSNYTLSNVSEFINNVFLNTLRSPSIYLEDADFDFTSVVDTNKVTNPSLFNSKVGLLSLYEYNKVKNLISGDRFFLSSRNGDNIWIGTNGGGFEAASVNSFASIRPVIEFRGNISYQSGGDGSRDNPYKVAGESSANIGDYLNSRYIGEYVTLGGEKFRIMETNTNYTKLISTGLLNNKTSIYSNGDSRYSEYNVIGTLTSYEWYQNSLIESDRDKIALNYYCLDEYKENSEYSTICSVDVNCLNNLEEGQDSRSCENAIRTYVALPKIGDMFTNNIYTSYYTITPYNSSSVYVVGSSATVSNVTSSSGVRVVISIKPSIKIHSGSGTSSDPYVLSSE